MLKIDQSAALAKIKYIANADLKAMDDVIKKRLHDKEKIVQDIASYIINSGGKRLRPILAMLSAKIFGYTGLRHINLAAAVEFIHTATLLHDDVVDDSKLRRGKPTANNSWNNKSSILVGDFLLSQAFRLMSEDNDLEVLDVLSKAAAVISEGEVKQLSSIANLNLSFVDYIDIISAKTAELFAAACQVGSIVAGANKSEQEAMFNFGLNLGISFQIIDDILDYQADKLTLGKNIGDDFAEHKVTLPLIIAFKQSDDNEKKFWLAALSSTIDQPENFNQALEIFNKYDILSQCFKIAVEYTEQAKTSLKLIPENSIKQALIEVIDFSLKRGF